MNSIYILIFSIIWLVVLYYWYGKKILQNRLAEPLDETPCPSNRLNDGTDYSPTLPLILFGHHFSSIAGAGPIVGPIVAVTFFGWGPAFIWLLIAGVFIGAIHDYFSLLISVRHNGVSIPETAKLLISKKASILFLSFVWLTLVLLVSVFASLTVNSLISNPEIVLPIFLLIPLAMIFGFINKHNILPLWLNTFIAISMLVLFILLGFLFPISLPFSGHTAYVIWFCILILYGFFASVLPVWLLLQPRDYISSWLLIFGLLLAFIGILVVQPYMNAPFVATFYSDKQGPIIPFLFILIACGAISGFHSIVASGTTSKQLNKEKDALFIGFGGMLVETIIGIICIIIAGGVTIWGQDKGQLQHIFYNGGGGAIAVYGAGFGKLTSFIFSHKIGAIIGITIVNVFILTTLDTGVRLARFITQEMLEEKMPKMFNNRFIFTFIPIIPIVILGITNSWASVWPIFGAANQLVAALVFIVITEYLYSRNKPLKYTILPTIFMLIMTSFALIWMGYKFYFIEHNILLGTISIILIILAVMVILEGFKKIKSNRVNN